MSFQFGDGFDCYTAIIDAFNGYWDAGNAAATETLVTGRFSGSMAVSIASSSTNNLMTKTSGVNDAVHHLVVAFRQTAAITGSTLGLYLQLLDGTTGQCAIVFRSDGTILLTAGTAAGATLATYAGAVTVNNTWYAFEFEIVINNSTGSFKVRKNGNTVDDHSTTGIDTQGSANAYANKLQINQQAAVSTQQFDDLYWRSDASSVPWMGDIRCYTRMPASDAAVQFSRSTGATNFSCVDEAQQNAATDYVFSSTPGHADLYGIAPIASTPLTTFAVTTRAYAIKSDAGTRTMAVQLKSGTAVTATAWNPADQVNTTLAGGNLTATFTSGTSNAGVRSVFSSASGKYYFEVLCTNATNATVGLGLASVNLGTLYNSGNGAAGTTTWVGTFLWVGTSLVVNMGGSIANGDVVCVAVDLTAKLIWFRRGAGNWNNSGTANPATGTGGFDITSIATGALYALCGGHSTANITANFGATAFAQAVPSGFAMMFGSPGTIVTSPTVVLTPSNWQWAWRHDVVDPATGSAWTAAAVNAAQVGPVVVA